jgi:hypothetical protein
MILDFILEAMKVVAVLIQNLQKDDALTIEKNGENRKIVIPKSIVLGFIGFLTMAVMVLLR